MREDIPEALRQPTKKIRQPRFQLTLVGWGAIGLILLVLGVGFSWRWASSSGLWPSQSSQPQQPHPVATTASAANRKASESLLGHLPYAEAPANTLQPITGDSNIRLRVSAAKQFQAMVEAAQADGITLVPISGFRSIADQKYLFFDVKAERGQVATQRAQTSAPPGYSEHHTGYAVDIGDGTQPETNLHPNFDATPAFYWLQANAARFSFELSFPKNNSQGVSYEPWHWRFVGDQDSLETFYKAKNLNQK